jgi:hypothetical protein
MQDGYRTDDPTATVWRPPGGRMGTGAPDNTAEPGASPQLPSIADQSGIAHLEEDQLAGLGIVGDRDRIAASETGVAETGAVAI